MKYLRFRISQKLKRFFNPLVCSRCGLLKSKWHYNATVKIAYCPRCMMYRAFTCCNLYINYAYRNCAVLDDEETHLVDALMTSTLQEWSARWHPQLCDSQIVFLRGLILRHQWYEICELLRPYISLPGLAERSFDIWEDALFYYVDNSRSNKC